MAQTMTSIFKIVFEKSFLLTFPVQKMFSGMTVDSYMIGQMKIVVASMVKSMGYEKIDAEAFELLSFLAQGFLSRMARNTSEFDGVKVKILI